MAPELCWFVDGPRAGTIQPVPHEGTTFELTLECHVADGTVTYELAFASYGDPTFGVYRVRRH